jgi:hypothetical protein
VGWIFAESFGEIGGLQTMLTKEKLMGAVSLLTTETCHKEHKDMLHHGLRICPVCRAILAESESNSTKDAK